MDKFLRLILVLLIFLALIPLYSRYKESAGPIPPGVYLGGMSLIGIDDPAEVRQHLDAVYQQPIAVQFGSTRLVLEPHEVDFHIEVEQMMREAEKYLDGGVFMDIALRQALGYEQQRRDVPLRFVLNTDKLRAWLEEAAQTHNSSPGGPRLVPPTNRWSEAGQIEAAGNEPTEISNPINEVNSDVRSTSARLPAGFVGVYSRDWTWVAGRTGQVLDINASLPQVIDALTTLENRTAHLVVSETPPLAPSMADLEAALDNYLNTSFPGFGAVYIEDLATGESVDVDADVAFSGMSTLKIGIAAAVMRRLENGVHPDDTASVDVGQWIDYALGDSNNYAANLLLAYLGDQDRNLGARRFTEFMRTLGYTNTYMQTGYDQQGAVAPISTPANRQSVWDTRPDPNLQTTPREMGRFLADLFYCSQGEGPMLEYFADELSAEKCLTVLFYMTHDEFQQMTWAGLPRPDSTWILHKHGFAAESHSDVALIWSHNGPYTLSIFLWRAGWMDWFTSNRTMKTISRITWNFFEFRAQALGLEEVPYFILEPPPGYQRVLVNRVPVISRGE